MIRAYKIAFTLLRPFVLLLYPHRRLGRENIPEGPCIFCANHSNFIDPLLLVYAIWPRFGVHMIAKAELFRIPFLGWAMRRIGAVPVDRGRNDMSAVRTSLRLLRDGGKLLIFPEGTRVQADDAVQAKSGAVRMAARAGVPLVPVYIPRGKRIFRRSDVVIGVPYHVGRDDTRPHEELAEELMNKIRALAPISP